MTDMEANCLSIKEALARLDEVAPGVPLLALGQTVFWDEPMKAGVALVARDSGSNRKFVAGVHDTDYFAKLPSGERRKGEFKAFPHNGTTTRSLWSAAGEFSALFGSETVITRQDLLAAGTRLERIIRARPEFLDEATEAYGWRGIVSLDDDPPIVREVPLNRVFEPLQKTLNWAIEKSLESLPESEAKNAQPTVDDIWTKVCDAYERHENGTITDLYVDLLPAMYDLAAGESVPIEAVRTSELLRFNALTCKLPRFELVDLFLAKASSGKVKQAYDEALQGSEIYGLSRFGEGAIPFDLVVPGVGRGTIRIGSRALVISTPTPLFASFSKPIESVEDLAAVIEKKFGTDCALIGKAVTLIGMLSIEFAFVFHEGASSYVKYTQLFHRSLEAAGFGLDWNPILRIGYCPWEAMRATQGWLRLPKELQSAFGAEEICAPSFASRWKGVAQEQRVLLTQLGELRRPVDLIQFLDQHLGGAWNSLSKDYHELFSQMKQRLVHLEEVRALRLKQYSVVDAAKLGRLEAERASGEHFRREIFEKTPSAEGLKEREQLQIELETAKRQVEDARALLKSLLREQSNVAKEDEARRLHERRRNIELEAELQRVKLVRSAILASTNLDHAGRRPSAWWFPLVSPDGSWFRETIATAQCRFEPLSFRTATTPA